MLIIKWILLNIAILSSLQNYSQTANRADEIVINSSSQPLRTILEEISNKYGYNFIYNDELVNDVKINCRIKSNSPEKLLSKIFGKQDISFKIFNENSVVLYKEKHPKKELFKAVVIDNNITNIDTPRVFVKPIMISRGKLIYPPEAVRNKIEGEVTVKFLIDGAGEVLNTIIQNSSGSSVLDSASVNYSKDLKFLPAESNGKTKKIWMSMLFKYYIAND